MRFSPDPRAASWARRARRGAPASSRSSPSTWAALPPTSATIAGEFERALDVEVGGVRLRTPILRIHTVAAGGGSIVHFDGVRLRVGPESAGANPGPGLLPARRTAHGHGLQCLVRAHPAGFLSRGVRRQRRSAAGRRAWCSAKFAALAAATMRRGRTRSPAALAAGCIRIAVENMANAIKKISVQRGHDVTGYTLTCFGGAAGQHACLVADALGMRRVFIHPHGGRACRPTASASPMPWPCASRTIEEALDDAALARLARAVRAARARGPRRARRPGLRRAIACDRARAAAQVRRHGFHADAAADAAIHDGLARAPTFSRNTACAMAFTCPGAPSSSTRFRWRRAAARRIPHRRRPRYAPRAGALRAARHAPRVLRRRNGSTRLSTRATRCGRAMSIDGPAVDLRAPQHHRHRTGLARDADAGRSPGAREDSARRSAKPPRRAPTRCCSRSSTICSWPSPSRWA